MKLDFPGRVTSGPILPGQLRCGAILEFEQGCPEVGRALLAHGRLGHAVVGVGELGNLLVGVDPDSRDNAGTLHLIGPHNATDVREGLPDAQGGGDRSCGLSHQ